MYPTKKISHKLLLIIFFLSFINSTQAVPKESLHDFSEEKKIVCQIEIYKNIINASKQKKFNESQYYYLYITIMNIFPELLELLLMDEDINLEQYVNIKYCSKQVLDDWLLKLEKIESKNIDELLLIASEKFKSKEDEKLVGYFDYMKEKNDFNERHQVWIDTTGYVWRQIYYEKYTSDLLVENMIKKEIEKSQDMFK